MNRQIQLQKVLITNLVMYRTDRKLVLAITEMAHDIRAPSP